MPTAASPSIDRIVNNLRGRCTSSCARPVMQRARFSGGRRSAVDPGLPVFRMKTMDERVGESLARRRFLMTLMALFAVVAAIWR
jgi:hypothetical protein